MEKIKIFMNSFQTVMENKIVPVAAKFSGERHLSALRDGLTILVPFTVIGGLSLMIVNPPVDLTMMKPTNPLFVFLITWKKWANAYSNLLTIPFNLPIGVISIYTVLGVSYRLAKSYQMDAFPNALTALFVFFCVAAVPQAIKKGSYIDVSGLGSTSMFTAIIIGLLVIEISHFLIKKNIKITMPASVPPMVAGPFEVLIPMLGNMIIFMALNQLCLAITKAGLTSLVFTIFSPLISATASLPSMLFIVTLTVVFWFFGIHGDNMVSAITPPIFTNNLVANLDAYNKGQPIPNIIAGNFTFIFGLAIVYLAFLFNMNVFCKNEKLKSLGRLAIPSSLFNINEPLVFGIPTVLNILTFIPSVICTILNVSVAYLATYFGFMSKTCMSVPWTLPAPL